LALYVLEPKTRNSRALKILSVGESGLKKIKRRLLSKGLVRPTGDGFKVLVPGLKPEPGEAGGHLVSKSDAIEKENKVAPLRRVRSLGEILRDYRFRFLPSQPGRTGGAFLFYPLENQLDVWFPVLGLGLLG
jgi:hypothetical protein